MTHAGDFWSRRKARVVEEEQADARAQEAHEMALRDAELAGKSDEDILEELGLPDPDSLQPGDDFKAFLARAVPDRLRRRALRRLWVSNPALANLDGLLDYGEDFTDKAMVIENLQTVYQVGKGMLSHVEELAQQVAEDGDPPQAEPVPQEPELAETELLVEPTPESEPETAAKPMAQVPSSPEDDPSHTPPRRRMRFAFEDPQEAYT
ncbi:Protein of unknown function [Roseovarius pacificus]|uniref:DUF3306 domain-containing protein n=1 Tax=Roseovarius pacificus TaxID=337701 RepID=A0A1M7F7E5_9RHOB|nr:DUF3306 domain-containing protein [Roseovarius pacificus]GGO58927.1 hypothetical protein GCM10011315_29750 [Roseovarius pacificus]SHL99946.1 Protein of unknown function [Roseovarius pacificus]